MLALSLGVLLSSRNGVTICSVGVIVAIWPRVRIVPKLDGSLGLQFSGPLNLVFLLPLKSLPPSLLELLFVYAPCSFREQKEQIKLCLLVWLGDGFPSHGLSVSSIQDRE